MKFGIREICDVVLRAKSTQKIGNKIFYKNEPVCYFDTLKTSTLEGAATTVYATGGRGNARLLSWDGERTLTFTMEDALISPIGLSILTGAGLLEASENIPIVVHTTEIIDISTAEYDDNGMPRIELSKMPKTSSDASIYVMGLNDAGEVITEPYLYTYVGVKEVSSTYEINFLSNNFNGSSYSNIPNEPYDNLKLSALQTVLVDYYFEQNSNAFVVNISPDEFGGSFYLEGSTLWRDQASGKDLPAEFIIPNCRVQSNFTFSMSSSGDPSSFTFTMDAFPDYTRWDKTKKVLTQIQVLGGDFINTQENRTETWAKTAEDIVNNVETGIYETYNVTAYSTKYLYDLRNVTTAPDSTNTTWDDGIYGFEQTFWLPQNPTPQNYVVKQFFTEEAITYNPVLYRQTVTADNLTKFNDITDATRVDTNSYKISQRIIKSSTLAASKIVFTVTGLNPSYRYIFQIQPQYQDDIKGQLYSVCLPSPLETSDKTFTISDNLKPGAAKNTYALKLTRDSIKADDIAKDTNYWSYLDAIGWLSVAEGTGTNANKFDGVVTINLRPVYEPLSNPIKDADLYSHSGTFKSVKIYLLADKNDTPSTENLVKTYTYYDILKKINSNTPGVTLSINSGKDSIDFPNSTWHQYETDPPYGVVIELENDWYKFTGKNIFPSPIKTSAGTTAYNSVFFTCTTKEAQG